MNAGRWLVRNLSTLGLALLLALAVWVSSVVSVDPNEECLVPRSLPLEVRGANPDFLLFGEVPETVELRLWAPRSICLQMAEDPAAVQAWFSLSGLGEGVHQIDIAYSIVSIYKPVRVLSLEPLAVQIRLEEFAVRTLPLQPVILGDPFPGYTTGPMILSDSRVVISGTRQLVESVAVAQVVLDITNSVAEINLVRPVLLLDGQGGAVIGLAVEPGLVTVRQLIERPGTFRDVTVRVIYSGQPSSGYRLTSITPAPQVVTVFSSDEQLIREMPGFVETEPLDLNGATDDIEVRLGLILPEGVFVDGDPTVLVQVGIAAIESSLTIKVPVETIGLAQGLQALVEPPMVDVILFGPIPILENLQPLDVRIVLDLTGLVPGVYSLTPLIEILPVGLQVESILPASIQVELILAPTGQPTPGQPLTTPTPTATPQ